MIARSTVSARLLGIRRVKRPFCINNDGEIVKRTEIIFVTELERCEEALRSWRL